MEQFDYGENFTFPDDKSDIGIAGNVLPRSTATCHQENRCLRVDACPLSVPLGWMQAAGRQDLTGLRVLCAAGGSF